MRLTPMLATLVAAAALAGCAGSPPAATDPAPTAPPAQTATAAETAAAASPVAGCEFHRLEDAAAVLNVPMNPVPKTDEVEPGSTANKFLSCVYWSADGTRYANIGHRAALTAAGAADTRSQFANQRTADAVGIPGLGDDAYWDTPNGQILVLVGDDLLLVSTGVKDAPAEARSRDDTTKLATLVVRHLPR
ncbi:hypothetical protein [Asanoa iriomotensis]|uniref:DUF3558 domain-containing protein n=1 Tax=Asanoa iriomotensis TaxID=234613 RepID=A0ABQ4C3S1_9ACTN|nr:hypothetical protein [Asanoa iriomotensis]GIF57407.1 hypothetical protein Air01nite_35020 [Asanoa iriomotensis]